MKLETVLKVILPACIYSLVSVAVAQAENETSQSTANGLLEAFSKGQTKALFRYSGQYRDSNLRLLQDSSTPAIPDRKVQQYSAVGGFIGFETAPWFNTTVGATLYGAAPFGSNPDDRRGLGGLYEEDGGQDPYAVLGELYIRYQHQGHVLQIGRKEMPNYRMVSTSDIRFSPVTHSGAVYENSVVKDLGLKLGYIMMMKERNAKKFIGMARGARLTESTNGKQLIRGDYDPVNYDETGYNGEKKEMAMLGITYQKERFSLDVWNYYVNDFVNSLYLEGQYTYQQSAGNFGLTLAAQFTDQRDVGSHIAGDIDTWHYGLSIRTVTRGVSLFVNYNEVAYNEGSYDGGTLFVRWGTPQMFNSFQVQDSELAGTRSLGAGIQVDFGHYGLIPGIVMRWRYGSYDLPDDLGFTDARQDRREATFDLRYSFSRPSGFGIFTKMQGLSLQFRLAINNYRTDYDFEAYREIHGYDFQSVTSDFYGARLYLDYHF